MPDLFPNVFFCWAPYDEQTTYEIKVEVNGIPLKDDEVGKRYRYGQKRTESRTIYNIISFIEQYENSYGENDNAQSDFIIFYKRSSSTNMDISQLSKHYPWKNVGTSMRWNVLLSCKLLVLILVLNGFFGKIQDPFLPHLSIFDFFNQIPGLFEITLKLLFIISSIFLFFNYRVRLMCRTLGIVVLLCLIAIKPYFRNHILICACVFFLASLHKKEDSPYLLFYQLALVYFGAALNKMLQVDWWNGIYMHHWMTNIMDNPLYLLVYNTTETLSFAKGLSWFSMILEVIIGLFLIFKKKRSYAIFLILFFHLILFTVTKERFGHFLDSILVILIAFSGLNSDENKLRLNINNGFITPLIKKLFDWDNLWVIQVSNEKIFSLANDKTKVKGFNAIRFLLLSSSSFYILLFIADLLFRFILNQPYQHYVQTIIYWGLLIFFFFGFRAIKKSVSPLQS